jgi:hypothetical protein
MSRQSYGIYTTLGGLPLAIELEWPFHRSTSGADFYVLHGEVRLENGSGLHALVAVQLTLTVREVLPSLEPKDAEAPVLNLLRKETDRKQLEYVKSPKRLPVPFNSRVYDFKRKDWAFFQADDQQITTLLLRRVFWESRAGGEKTWVGDPVDAQYLGTIPQHMVELARGIPEIALEGEHARATPALISAGAEMESDMRRTLEELERKHAFERG